MIFQKLISHCKPIPVMKTGFSLCSISNREKPVFITLEPCNENRIFPVWKYYTEKTLFWPCTGPVRDCSAGKLRAHFQATDLAALMVVTVWGSVERISGPSHEVNSQSIVTRDWLRSFQQLYGPSWQVLWWTCQGRDFCQADPWPERICNPIMTMFTFQLDNTKR